MERIAVFVDDAVYAQRLLEPLRAEPSIVWLVVACPPRLTHRIGKYVAHRSREQWRERWSQRLREQLAPALGPAPEGQAHEWLVAKGPLPALLQRLQARHGAGLRVLDARRPKLGVSAPPLAPGQQPDATQRWTTPVAVSSALSLMLALTD